MAAEFVNEVETTLDDFTLLVLDDYHIISEQLLIVAFVEYILAMLPEKLRIIIASRSIYGIPTSTLYVNEELTVINAQDLLFRMEEIRDLARLNYHIRLTEEEAREISAQSDGWITSILLSLRDGGKGFSPSKLKGAREQVYDYLAREVFSHLSTGMKNFLLVTALCDNFDVEMADFTLGITNSENLIQQLGDQNLFISSTQNASGTSYQYHQLFRDFNPNSQKKQVSKDLPFKVGLPVGTNSMMILSRRLLTTWLLAIGNGQHLLWIDLPDRCI